MQGVSYDLVAKADEPIVVAPLGDIQWAGEEDAISYSRLEQHIETCCTLNASFLGMGDYIDFMSPSNRARLAAAALYDTAMDVIDSKALDLTLDLYQRLLRKTKGKWLGLLEGHHFTPLKTGDTTDMRLCQMLEAPFLGTSGYIRLRFFPTEEARKRHEKKNGSAGKPGCVFLWAHHGRGSGKAHAPILKLENAATYWKADVMLMGHMTKQAFAPIQRLEPSFYGDSFRLVHKNIYLVGTGGWSKGYMEGAKQGNIPRGNYVEQGMMNPVALGAPVIRIWPRWNDHPKGDEPTFAPIIKVEA